MKRTLILDDDLLHLVESNENETVCGVDVEELAEVKSLYNQESFEEALAQYVREDLCPKCFPDVTTFETKAEIISEKEAEKIIESAKGVRI